MHNSLRQFLRRLLGNRLHLSVGSQSMTLASAGWKKSISVLANQTLISNQLKSQCDTILASPSCSALPLLITLSDVLGRLFIVTPPKNTAQFSDLIAATRMRFQTLYGNNHDDWEINASWQMDRPFLACAYPRSLLTTLRQTAKEHNLLLLSIKPYFVTAWNQWCSKISRTAWFGVIQDDVLTLGIVSELYPASLVAIRSIPIHGHTAEWLEEQVTRIALQSHVRSPTQVQLVGNLYNYWKKSSNEEQLVINLEEQSKRSSKINLFSRRFSAFQFDFAPSSILRSAYLTKIRTWFFVGIGIALCCSAAIFGSKQLIQIDENGKLAQQLTLQLNARNNQNSNNQKAGVAETKITDIHATAVNTAIAQLNLPWQDLLNAMESATPVTVALLSLEPDARRNLVKGVAEAKDYEAMVRYIELLKKEDFLSGVFLSSHEINQLDSNKPIRFQFEANWIAS